MSKIGHAAKDERGRYSGGRSGDQSREEVCIRTWYNRPWSHVLRAADPEIRERIADAMEAACANDHIGYDQNQRNSLLRKCRALGYDPGAVTADCECDCSSLVAVCCMYAGIREQALYKEGNCATTSTLRRWLMDTGAFDLYVGKGYLTSPDRLMRGDILLYEGHHVAVNLADGAKIPLLGRGSKGMEVLWVQKRINALGVDRLDEDGEFGPLTERAVREVQQRFRLADVDGIVGRDTRDVLRV